MSRHRRAIVCRSIVALLDVGMRLVDGRLQPGRVRKWIQTNIRITDKIILGVDAESEGAT